MGTRHIVVEIDIEDGGQSPIAKARVVEPSEDQEVSEVQADPPKPEKVMAEINFYRTYYYGA